MTFISGQLWRSINLQRIKVYHCFTTVYKEWKDQRKDQIIEQRRSDNSPHHFRNWNKAIHIKNYVGGGSARFSQHLEQMHSVKNYLFITNIAFCTAAPSP